MHWRMPAQNWVWRVFAVAGDVLARFHGAAVAHDAQTIVRITSDCPFYDPFLLDEMLEEFAAENRDSLTVDYLTNCTLKRTYPRGLDTEICTFEALDRTFRKRTALRSENT